MRALHVRDWNTILLSLISSHAHFSKDVVTGSRETAIFTFLASFSEGALIVISKIEAILKKKETNYLIKIENQALANAFWFRNQELTFVR